MASHPSPFHRQRQSNKTLDPNSDTAKFLYTILKQLDLKNIDWNEVARSLDITNGHAARMRWSRFRAQIEGLDNSYSRKSVRRVEDFKKEKEFNKRRDDPYVGNYDLNTMSAKRMKIDENVGVKMENLMRDDVRRNNATPRTIRDENAGRISTVNGVNVHHPTMTTITDPLSLPSYSDMSQYPTTDALSSQRSGIAFNRHAEDIHGLPSQQWQNHLTETGYEYGADRPNVSSRPYSFGLSMPANQHSYSSMYGNQYPQYYNYGQQAPRAQFRVSNAYANNQFQPHVGQTMQNPSMPAYALPGRKAGSLTQVQATNVTQPTTSASSQHRTQPATFLNSTANEHLHSQAVEMAIQASYPWPHSDATVSQLVSQAEEAARRLPDAEDRNTAVNENNRAVNLDGSIMGVDTSITDTTGHHSYPAGVDVVHGVKQEDTSGTIPTSNAGAVSIPTSAEFEALAAVKVEAVGVSTEGPAIKIEPDM